MVILLNTIRNETLNLVLPTVIMSSDIEALQKVSNGKPVRIFLPITDGKELARAQCVYQETSPPKFDLIFKPGHLPVDDIDLKQPCIVSIDLGGPTLSLETKILKIANPQTLQMVIQKSISHEQMREFFRVDATTQVISKSFQTELLGKDNQEWSLQGQTIDISGSGILAVFDSAPPIDKQIKLEITIPSAEVDTIHILAHPVRTQELSDGRFEVAYHFDDITMEDRDAIIGCCLIIQRKMLRLKVQVKGS